MDTTDLGMLRGKTLLLLQKLKLNQEKVKDTLNGTLNASSLSNTSRRSNRYQGVSNSSEPTVAKKSSRSKESTRDARHKLSQRQSSRSPKYAPISAIQHESGYAEKIAKYRSSGVSSLENSFQDSRYMSGSYSNTPTKAAVKMNGYSMPNGTGTSTPPNSGSVVSAISERTRTSTPKQQTTQSRTGTPKTDTPKSILKRRKIIDDHVKVESRYPQPDTVGVTPRRIQLNFSYSDDTKTPLAGLNSSLRSDSSRSPYTKNLDGSYIEEFLDEGDGTDGKVNPRSQMNTSAQQGLLEDVGNDRKYAGIARALSQRPKSDVFHSAEQVLGDEPADSSSKLVTRSPKMKKLLTDHGPPLLGYDWIAGVLENDAEKLDVSEALLEDIREFRRVNKVDCYSNLRPSQMVESSTLVDDSIELRNPGHSCIHGYTINERLFTYPMNVDEDGRSICPVCVSRRKDPTHQSPGFVRVSIPRSSLESPYRLKPHRRRSFDSSDSCALANHCVAGWECSKPSMLPSAGGLDLQREKQKIEAELGSTAKDAQRHADSHSRQARITDDLLDLSYSFRYDLHDLEKKRGLGKVEPPHTALQQMQLDDIQTRTTGVPSTAFPRQFMDRLERDPRNVRRVAALSSAYPVL